MDLRKHCQPLVIAALLALTGAMLPWSVSAQDEAAPAADAPKSSASPSEALALKQGRVAERFQRLEELMLKMAEIDEANNPRRSALLKRAVAQSKDEHIHLQLETLAKLLREQQLKRAVDNQTEARTDLQALLELLLSEDRGERIRDERERIEGYIKELRRIERLQQGLRGRNENEDDADRLAQLQDELAKRTAELNRKIAEDAGEGNSEGNNQGDSEGNSKGDSEGNSKGDSEGNSKGDSEGNSKGDSEGNSKGDSEGDSKGDSEGNSKGDSEGNSKGDSEGNSKGDSEGNSKGDSEGNSKGDSEGNSKGDSEGNSKGDSEGNSKGDSEGNSKGDSEGNSKGDSEGNSKGDSEGNSKGDSEGDSKGDSQGDSKGDSEGGSSPSGGPKPPKSEDNPARQRIKAAEEKMREAQQRLEEARRKESIEDQREAEKELQAAIDKLEEILRQLREEEIERMLAMLEARFQKMRQMQLKVYEDTKRLDIATRETQDPALEARAGKLSFEERKIVIEADKCLTLLREEGSSIAFPEVLDQIREDMVQVVDRLARVKVGPVTQTIEEDIIDALEQAIEALQKAQKDMEEMPPMPPGSGEGGPPQDQPLVDQIAELKMIRSMEVRIKSRTDRYSRLLDDIEDPTGQATEQELIDALRGLSDRQSRIQQITRDIVLGKNQ